MIDDPNEVGALVEALEAALPFPAVIERDMLRTLRAQTPPVPARADSTVTEVHYAGDEGGIVCRLAPCEDGNAIVISLTYLRIPARLPMAAAADRYRKRRIKRIRRQGLTMA